MNLAIALRISTTIVVVAIAVFLIWKPPKLNTTVVVLSGMMVTVPFLHFFAQRSLDKFEKDTAAAEQRAKDEVQASELDEARKERDVSRADRDSARRERDRLLDELHAAKALINAANESFPFIDYQIRLKEGMHELEIRAYVRIIGDSPLHDFEFKVHGINDDTLHDEPGRASIFPGRTKLLFATTVVPDFQGIGLAVASRSNIGSFHQSSDFSMDSSGDQMFVKADAVVRLEVGFPKPVLLQRARRTPSEKPSYWRVIGGEHVTLALDSWRVEQVEEMQEHWIEFSSETR